MNTTDNIGSDRIEPAIRALRQLSPGSQCAGAELTNEWSGAREGVPANKTRGQVRVGNWQPR